MLVVVQFLHEAVEIQAITALLDHTVAANQPLQLLLYAGIYHRRMVQLPGPQIEGDFIDIVHASGGRLTIQTLHKAFHPVPRQYKSGHRIFADRSQRIDHFLFVASTAQMRLKTVVQVGCRTADHKPATIQHFVKQVLGRLFNQGCGKDTSLLDKGPNPARQFCHVGSLFVGVGKDFGDRSKPSQLGLHQVFLLLLVKLLPEHGCQRAGAGVVPQQPDRIIHR